MTQVLVKNLNTVLYYRERIFAFIVFGIVLCLAYYAYMVHATIVNVVEREKIVKEIRDESTSISELETIYFATKNKINIELAHAKGFEDSEVSSFISKKSLTTLASHNEL